MFRNNNKICIYMHSKCTASLPPMWINDLYVSFSSDFKLNQMLSRTWSIPALTLEKTLKLQLKLYTQFCILKHNGGEQTLQLDILRIIKSNDEQQQWHRCHVLAHITPFQNVLLKKYQFLVVRLLFFFIYKTVVVTSCQMLHCWAATQTNS